MTIKETRPYQVAEILIVGSCLLAALALAAAFMTEILFNMLGVPI